MAQVYRSVGVTVARMVGESAAMDAVAHRVRAKAVALAAQHRESGDFGSSITEPQRVRGKRGVMDRIVSATDPAAVSIEFGHLTRRGKHMEGPQKFVPGLHIMGRAADL